MFRGIDLCDRNCMLCPPDNESRRISSNRLRKANKSNNIDSRQDLCDTSELTALTL